MLPKQEHPLIMTLEYQDGKTAPFCCALGLHYSETQFVNAVKVLWYQLHTELATKASEKVA